MLIYQHSLADVAIADLHFDDGSIRTAWETPDGHQYVGDDNGERVYGVWFLLRCAPERNRRVQVLSRGDPFGGFEFHTTSKFLRCPKPAGPIGASSAALRSHSATVR